MKTAYCQRLLASTLLISAAGLGTPAYAQDQAADEGDEVIVVTGSRIASPTLTSASPLQVIDATNIDEAGDVNIQELLNDNPAVSSPTINRTNSNFSTSSAGVATVDLRNLGVARTLVLVNGRRMVSGLPGSSGVDLNVIPTQFIERIDILTGGASSIYGSDAVAGVVNIIYRDDFEGIELDGQLGISERGDDTLRSINATIGSNFADGRGNVTVHAGYSRQGGVFSRNRPNLGAAIDQSSLGALTGNIPEFFQTLVPFRSGFAPQGTFFLDPGAPGIDANGDGDFDDIGDTAAIPAQTRTFDQCSGAIRTTNTNGEGCDGTGFNRSAFRIIAVPTERYTLAMRANYEVTEGVGVFLEANYAKTSVSTIIEPFPLASSGPGGLYQATGGNFDIEQDITLAPGAPIPAAGGAVIGCNAVTRVCRVRNPFIPQAFYDLAADTVSTIGTPTQATTPNGLRDIGFQQRMTSFGNRGSTADRNTFRILGGLQGSISSNWRYDAYYAYGETTEAQFSSGQTNTANFRQALNSIPDINDVDGDGDRTEAICADSQARAEGCAPANIFGANLLSPAAIAYIQAPASRVVRVAQNLAGANLSGTLGDPWGAGAIGVAVGVEYRKESSSAINDVLTQVGGNGGNALPNVIGSFDVAEAYMELAVPLLSETPFFHQLEARGAFRISDYSTVGRTYAYNAGLEWAPVPDIRFRAVYARATRAPNIGELFAPPTQTFPPGINDPCLGILATGGGDTGTNCRAESGVALNISQNPVAGFTLTQADVQGLGGFIPGNPNLEAETSDSYTLGVVINPRSISWLRNFAFTIDYFNIKVDNAIQVIPFQYILDQCYNEGVAEFCNRVQRRLVNEGPNNAGSIFNINTSTVNTGYNRTEGFDVTGSWRQDLGDWGLSGRLSLNVTYTRLLEGEIEEVGGVINPYAGEIGFSKDRIFGTLGYQNGDFGLTLRGTWIGEAYLDNVFVQAYGGDGTQNGPDSDLWRVGSEFTMDMQLRFTPGDHYEFYVGVNNMFDNSPAYIPTNLPGNNTGTETNSGTYDAIGRRFYAGARLRF